MDLLTPDLRALLRANAVAHQEAMQFDAAEPDPAPVVKFFNPLGAATWLATELDSDGDTLFGRSSPRFRRCAASLERLRRVADLGFGCPELGSFSLGEIAALRVGGGLGIERDLCFASAVPLSVWADTARRAGSILWAQQLLARLAPHPDRPSNSDQLPPSDEGGG